MFKRISRVWSVYSSFMRNAFLTMLAYRLRYVTGILTYLLLTSVHYFIWQAVYSGRDTGSAIYGFTVGQMITYVAVGWISRSFYFSNIDEEIEDLVSSGQISTYLLRPVGLQPMLLSRAVGESLFRITFFSTPIALVLILVFPILPPASPFAFFMFCFSTCVGFLVLAQFNFLLGLLAFDLKSINGIMRAKYYLVQLCSGLLLPLEFFPNWAEKLLNLLPFKTIAYVPLQFYLGKVSSDQLVSVLLNQGFWIFFLFTLGYLMWSRALSRLTLQGG